MLAAVERKYNTEPKVLGKLIKTLSVLPTFVAQIHGKIVYVFNI